MSVHCPTGPSIISTCAWIILLRPTWMKSGESRPSKRPRLSVSPTGSPSPNRQFPLRSLARSRRRATGGGIPVIDFSRCTNCMECIDFCLFGVYGIDQQETILVEQPDNCRKGCPACSRVCPENAIIFPQHKTPVIAGDPSIGGEMKIDLSQLFGKPNDVGDGCPRTRRAIEAGRPSTGGCRGGPAPKGKIRTAGEGRIGRIDR